MKKNLIFLVFCFLQINCWSQKNTLPTVDLQNPKQKKVVKLSEMLSNLSLVKLETSKDILIGEGTKYLVSEKFIITAGSDKILLFSNTGKYIRTIAVTGKGPNEYANIVACVMDDKNGILYINQRDDPGIILSYNLNKNEPVRTFVYCQTCLRWQGGCFTNCSLSSIYNRNSIELTRFSTSY